MFAASKPFASLSSGLLARKGQARPAMRRQVSLADTTEDLGWNDMGDPAPAPAEAAPAPAAEAVALPEVQPELPPVLVEREALAEEIATPASAPEPVAVQPALKPARVAKPRPALVVRKAKAAFTLRLDPDRHLRLRLASATRGISSQQLVTQALDALLATMPEVEALARQVPTAGSDRLGD